MRAIKLMAQVSAEHTLNLQLPADVPPGTAEVIVLINERPITRSSSSLREFMDKLQATDIPRRSKEEIDRSLEEERNAWEWDDVRDLPR